VKVEKMTMAEACQPTSAHQTSLSWLWYHLLDLTNAGTPENGQTPHRRTQHNANWTRTQVDFVLR
jgi:hypothetical protein